MVMEKSEIRKKKELCLKEYANNCYAALPKSLCISEKGSKVQNSLL